MREQAKSALNMLVSFHQQTCHPEPTALLLGLFFLFGS